MPSWTTLTTHHAIGLTTFLVTIALSSRVLRRRRPVGTSTAWLIGFLLVPYVTVPLYLILGDRKLRGVGRSGAAAARTWSRNESNTTEVTWLDRPEVALQQFLERARAATRSIHVSTFILGDDAVGQTILRVLSDRAREGIEVCVLIDGLFSPRAPRRALRELRAAGGRVAVFMPLLHLPWRGHRNVRNHRKLALFDGTIAIVGGMNLNDDSMGVEPRTDRWRDLAILVAGAAAAELEQVFRADWELARGDELVRAPIGTSSADIEIIPTGPDRAGDAWHDTVLQLLFDARQRISIATPYFAPDESLLQALAIAVGRGVEVTIVVPARSNHWLSDRVAGQLLRDLSRAGVRVFRFRPAMMHAKALLIDEEIAAVGSANFNARSLFLDFEVTAILHGRSHNQALAEWFVQTLASCDVGPPVAHGVNVPIEAVARLLSPLV